MKHSPVNAAPPLPRKRQPIFSSSRSYTPKIEPRQTPPAIVSVPSSPTEIVYPSSPSDLSPSVMTMRRGLSAAASYSLSVIIGISAPQVMLI